MKSSVFFSVNFVIHERKRKFNVSWKVFEKRGSPRAVGFSRFHAGFFVIEAVNLLSRTFRVLIRCGACVVQRLVTETRALLSVNARKIISNLFSTKSFDRAKAPETNPKNISLLISRISKFNSSLFFLDLGHYLTSARNWRFWPRFLPLGYSQYGSVASTLIREEIRWNVGIKIRGFFSRRCATWARHGRIEKGEQGVPDMLRREVARGHRCLEKIVVLAWSWCFESPYYVTLDTRRPAMHLFREKTKADLGRVNPGRGSSSSNYP